MLARKAGIPSLEPPRPGNRACMIPVFPNNSVPMNQASSANPMTSLEESSAFLASQSSPLLLGLGVLLLILINHAIFIEVVTAVHNRCTVPFFDRNKRFLYRSALYVLCCWSSPIWWKSPYGASPWCWLAWSRIFTRQLSLAEAPTQLLDTEKKSCPALGTRSP